MVMEVKDKFKPEPSVNVIAVYAGKGASHSWLWFVDLFEKYSIYPRFLDEVSVNDLRETSTLIVPGGDPVSLARAVGKKGLESMRKFVHRGGRYVGSCAGAYLPLRTSLSPLSHFNMVNLRIRNIGEKSDDNVKSYTPYGERCIIHPFRGDVIVRLDGQSMRAPVFGGPIFEWSDEVKILGVYEKVTEATQLFMDEGRVIELISGYPAVVRAETGRGDMLLMGPHLEYPGCDVGNRWLVSWIGKKDPPCEDYESTSQSSFLKFREVCGDLLVVSGSFVSLPAMWRIGVKAWEPEKLQYFALSIWKRVKKMKDCDTAIYPFEEISSSLERVIHGAKEIKRNLKMKRDTASLAEEMFDEILSATRKFMENYFLWKRIEDERKKA